MRSRWVPLLLYLFLPVPVLAQEARAEIRLENDVPYAKVAGLELLLDLATPKSGAGPFPAVVCIHGGGWTGGNRKQLTKTIEVLAGRGYVAVSPTYRLAPEARFPAAIEDCKAAVRWLRAHAKHYNIDPERIGATGISAGGHLACLLGVTRPDDGLEGTGGNADQSSAVRAVVSFFGPTDLTRKTWIPLVEEKNLKPFFGGTLEEKAELYKKASPVTYAGKHAPPFLFVHGSEDRVVHPDQSRLLAEKLKAAGASARLVVLEGEGHGWRGAKLHKSISDMVEFLDEHLKK